MKNLSAQLKPALAGGDAAAAVRVCQQVAMPITESAGGEFAGVEIGRTSLRARNPKNAPDAIDARVLEAWQGLVEAGKPLPKHEVISEGENAVRYYRPIMIQEVCLKCHGPSEALDDGLRHVLDSLYPDDDARGYKPGDLRGAFRVTLDLARVEGETPEHRGADEPGGSDPETGSIEKAAEGALVQYGSMHEVIGQKQHGGRIVLGDAVEQAHFFAVGALEGLRGEITVLDGEVFATGSDRRDHITALEAAGELKATLLIGSHVSKWFEHRAARNLGSADLEAFIETAASERGIDVTEPFMFTITGELFDVEFHVIRGACPVHAKRAGIELAPDEEPYRGKRAVVQGTLVGVFAKDAAGDLTHPGSSLHLHVIFEDPESGKKLTGHVDQTGLGKDALLRLPDLGGGR